jgi:NAD(P)-dependent dehydrogenase (short-subunit alcohol dehydrogenase family)
MRFQGKRVLVAGGGSIGPGMGNGKAAAILYAREGAEVLVVDQSGAGGGGDGGGDHRRGGRGARVRGRHDRR